jgi:adenine-specific DNA-methyltransferase
MAIKRAETYRHEDEAPLRPDVGTQAQFKQKKPPKTYTYDSSLSPALDYDGQNPARELGEELIRRILEADSLDDARAAAAELKALGQPFLDWAGKAERLSFDVPTLPLFVHERLSTKAILETLKGHERDRQMELQLFADPQLPLHQQLEAYTYPGKWTNRFILGDSLVVMNSLLEYEGLGGQVQMIYIDPPYGVKFGSNFQPFVRKRDVKNNDDGDMTREPEMVKAYRDTWELGLHSYLTYLRDRLKVARDLLTPTGSVFVQISDENVHHVRELMDEVFGPENFCAAIDYRTTGSQTSALLAQSFDHLLWYAKSRDLVKFRPPFAPDETGSWDPDQDLWIERPDGTRERLSRTQKEGTEPLPDGRVFRHRTVEPKSGSESTIFELEVDGRPFRPKAGKGWSSNRDGMERLREAKRLFVVGNSLRYIIYRDDFPFVEVGSTWGDTMVSGFAGAKLYVVQTAARVVQRCLQMTTDPGDLVLDPTCGSGTTAYVAEQWGRRWITIDTSRVPLALARQRLLTATFPYYALQDPERGPAAGFIYKRKQNTKGEEVGGIAPHVSLKSIANDEPPAEEVLVDRPEVDSKITRVTGPFVVEATIPTPVDVDGDGSEDSGAPADAGYVDRMLEALRRNPVLQLGGNTHLTLTNVKQPARSLYLSAEASLDPDGAPVAIVFGPENGAISEKLIYEAVTEAHMKHFDHLLLIGFAIEPNAREFVAKGEKMSPIPITYVQATPDLVMGDLLKTTRSSQLFSVAGLPDIDVRKLPDDRYQVELRGLDTFDPTTFQVQHRGGDDVPAWFLDTDWNELSFHVSQAFFPRTSAWDGLKRALKGEYEDSVWDHLAGTVSAPFGAGEFRRVAVKVIDDRGNELLVVKSLAEAE